MFVREFLDCIGWAGNKMSTLSVDSTVLWVWILNCVRTEEASWAVSMGLFLSLSALDCRCDVLPASGSCLDFPPMWPGIASQITSSYLKVTFVRVFCHSIGGEARTSHFSPLSLVIRCSLSSWWQVPFLPETSPAHFVRYPIVVTVD